MEKIESWLGYALYFHNTIDTHFLLMGVLGLAEQGAASIGSYFAGYIFDTVGNYNPVFWTGIAISTIGIILTWLLKPAFRKENGLEGRSA